MRPIGRVICIYIIFFLIVSMFISLVTALPPPPPPAPPAIDGSGTNITDGYDDHNSSVSTSGDDDNESINVSDQDSNQTDGLDEDETDSRCENGRFDSSETDIDCGGECGPCNSGKVCLYSTDCVTGYCNPGFTCSYPICNDGWQNGDETGVDCGGECAPCTILPVATGEVDKGQDSTGVDDKSTDSYGYISDGVPDTETQNIESDGGDDQKNPELEAAQQQSSMAVIVVIISGFVMLMAVLIVVFVWYIHNSHETESHHALIPAPEPISVQQTKTAPIEQPTDPRKETLKKYIDSCILRGYTPDSIREALVKYGWSQQEIDSILNG
jgi:hypothetical protein